MADAKRGKMHASASQLALVLLLIGWKGGADLLSQSHRVESAKPITFRHSNENRSNMRLQDIAIFMFKIRNRLLPYNILELFSSSSSNYNLRNSDFHVQRVKTVKYGKHSLRFFGPFLWSKLSMKVRNELSLSRFKANISRKDLSKLVSSLLRSRY